MSESNATEIAQRIKICDKYFDPIRESENDYPEDDISNYPDDLLPYFVSFEERAQYAFYQWMSNPPKRLQAWCNEKPFVTDDFYNVIGTLSVTTETYSLEDGKVCGVRLHSYNHFDYHGKYYARRGTVHLIANRKFW